MMLVDVSVNWIVSGVVPDDADCEKSATGRVKAALTVMRSDCVSTLSPAVLVAVRLTV